MPTVRVRKIWRRYVSPPTGLLRRLVQAVRELPVILGQPRLITMWISSARRAQAALITILPALYFIGPVLTGAIADSVYPPIQYKKRVLLVLERERTYQDPSRDALQRNLEVTGWVMGGGYVLLLLLAHGPAAVRLASRKSDTAAGRTIAPDSTRTKTIAISTTRPEMNRFLGSDNRYRLDKAIGSGGMGVVHAGYDTLLERPVALKKLFENRVSDQGAIARFKQEATALAALNHNHVVAVHDLLEDETGFWIVMELLTGGTLFDKMTEDEPLAIDYAVDVICKIADGLGFAHGMGVVHRDVKPMNILFSNDDTPKLADFGSAKISESNVHTQHGVAIGSPLYMSPEQAAAVPTDSRSDIYSLGVTLYHLVTGRVPFDGDLSAILAQHIGQDPRPPRDINSTVSADLSDVVLRMLRKKPSERYQCTEHVVTALRNSTVIAKAV